MYDLRFLSLRNEVWSRKHAQNELVKDIEKHNKELSQGKLSAKDIKQFEKEKAKQEKEIEELKVKLENVEKKLRKSKK